jgi:hypothetical protein
MTIEALSGAAAVALASTIVFLLIARSWQAVARNVGPTPRFSESMMREAAQRFRDELERLSDEQAAYLSGALIFVLLFAVAYTFRAQELFAGYPIWQMYVLLVLLGVAALLAAWRLTRTFVSRMRLRLQRDANIAIGCQLHQIAPDSSRVYHEVPTAAGIVDHVLLGQKGIYAVNVVPFRPVKNGTVELRGNELHISSSKKPHSIVDIGARTRRLERELSKRLGHNVKVRSVLAVPGWHVEQQNNEAHLLVNERTLAMLTGWKDRSEYLMNEDVAALQEELTARCSRL